MENLAICRRNFPAGQTVPHLMEICTVKDVLLCWRTGILRSGTKSVRKLPIRFQSLQMAAMRRQFFSTNRTSS